MELKALTAVSPIDGRYRNKTVGLSNYFSEYALIKYRVRVEIEYLLALSEIEISDSLSFTDSQKELLRAIYKDFDVESAQAVKDIESTINHDVKAVEYFIKSKLDAFGLIEAREFVHFGLTSQDINNTAVPLSLKEAFESELLPLIKKFKASLDSSIIDWKEIPMLAKTHGQPASPTKLGKEFRVFAERIENQLSTLEKMDFFGKFGGATGNFNAHIVAYPDIDWVSFSNAFLANSLGLKRLQYTTQIDHYDGISAFMDNLKRLNVIYLDLCRDVWTYISMNYFVQSLVDGEVGSSTMPHKVNPIDFENAEGNLGLANALLEHLSSKLPISRLQRDLTDSTVLRNIGVPIGHIMIAMQSMLKGWGKLVINKEAIDSDLDANWAVVGEAIQTILRRENYPNPYEKLKELTRTNDKITEITLHEFIDRLEVSDEIKLELKKISPFNYTGIY